MRFWRVVLTISVIVNSLFTKSKGDNVNDMDDIRSELKPFQAAISMYRASKLQFTEMNGFMLDGEPFLYKTKSESNSATGRRAIICTVPKAGSINVRILLMAGFMKDYNPGDDNLNDLLAKTGLQVSSLPVAELEEVFPDNEVLRFMVVRNPYSKLLSGYLNKIVDKRLIEYAPPGFHFGMSFHDFVRLTVEHLTLTPPNEVNTRNHFQVQHKMCAMNRGMTYDYYLKLESMPYWYEPFIRYTGLTNYTFGSVWNSTIHGYIGSKNCYYAPDGKSCADMFQHDITIERDTEAESRDSLKSEPSSHHSTSADSRLSEFYNPATAKLVTEWAALDFVMFNYPTWDGRRKTLPAFLRSLAEPPVPRHQ